ncbi:ArsI/CadI family heavy metal resistance metalloenzyme [Uliginosibacterium sediminicola]|uniref:ArsI/CadI family heavy metal resistance metalloenzyme n=1 Tax=Uliginosibacterium sediminicola TaxID=2024550 RepID=A0ABU9YU73_9RHOO
MKRMHIHIAVADLPQSIAFYSALFAAQPSVSKPDYAKWMLDDPRVNFAISQRGVAPGLDHLGIQVESAEELAELQTRQTQLDAPQLSQTGTACCYAQSDKHWIRDPQGIAWESFHTLADVPMFGAEQVAAGSACCAPTPVSVSLGMPTRKKSVASDSNNGAPDSTAKPGSCC